MLPALPRLRPVRVLLAPLLALGLAACMPSQPIIAVPTFQVQSVRLTGLTLPTFSSSATAYLTLQLLVNNPNPIALHMANIAANVVLDGTEVTKINLPDVDLPARGSAVQRADLSIPVTLATAANFLKVARGQQVSYRLDGTFTADLGLLGRPSFGPFTLVQGVLQQPAILP
ncbi:LEA type 2 family protein [Deinococcus sp. KNUC1210]|uniref:LEA type 2 family protein n=1 Tax=Deinococcus sp. KNUC1210 TaxID=2917691 RepID=UPI001EF016D4|nr:LEA type 2 family protein [Deinococcus sp. KNUC1210]ULH16433.1 LEA type 2 family protein [Deinococcus sp. KNUC1210]